jgi:cytochrome b561
MKLSNLHFVFLFLFVAVLFSGSFLPTNDQQKLFIVFLTVINAIAIYLTRPIETISNNDIANACKSIERKALKEKMKAWELEISQKN